MTQDAIQRLKANLAFFFLVCSICGFALGYVVASSETAKARDDGWFAECHTDTECADMFDGDGGPENQDETQK